VVKLTTLRYSFFFGKSEYDTEISNSLDKYANFSMPSRLVALAHEAIVLTFFISCATAVEVVVVPGVPILNHHLRQHSQHHCQNDHKN